MGSCPRDKFIDVERSRIRNQDNCATTLDVLRIMKPFIWPDNSVMKGEYKVYLRIIIVFSYILLIGGKIMLLTAPLFIGKMVQDLSANDYYSARFNAGFYVLFCCSAVTLDELRNISYRYIQKWAIIDLSAKFIENIFNMPYGWFIENNPTEIAHVLNRGVESSRDLTAFSVQLLVPTALEIIGVSLIFALKYECPYTSLALIIGVVLFGISTISIANSRIKIRKRVNDIDNEMHTVIGDGLSNYETVKYFTNEKHEIDKYTNVAIQHEKFNYIVFISLSLLNFIQETIKELTIISVLLIAIYYVKNGVLIVGDVVAMVSYLAFIFRPLYLLGTIYMTIIKSMAGLRDIITLSVQDVKIHDLPGAEELKLTDENGNFKADIVFDDVKFSYDKLVCPMSGSGHFRGLQKVNFTVLSGTTCAIIGATGSGKTTISRLLCRFYDVDSGAIRINSTNIAHVTQNSLRSCIGIVPQDTVLFHATLLENIRYGKMDATREEIHEAAKRAQLENFIKTLPSGIDTIVGERGMKLSGGEKQRVAIARCFLKNPPIIILDEATSALDINTEAEVQAALESLSINRTVIVIAHRLSTIVNAKQIIFMSNGRIEDCGTHDELLKSSKVYADLWKKQTKPAPAQ
ncbi:ATM1 putative (not with Plasmodium) [Babesia microti strain RI]|uniref:ATM1 putative (Not with Plasmodium) n=1 Tax=Babesia microti (strain RI) TaxID=1133968 RepID=A0A1N6LW94_BABMR|nr:ATM1 putative (not with Plasmodium) [Babesia microti strain RI]SIO73138.1 ATM1 putative (not with Plasmodium) [Babesia microti strain RI]|eukprot:XP_021337250.1 ATM1 putative (not with Plasmodium) [Babesia microti strain RI]